MSLANRIIKYNCLALIFLSFLVLLYQQVKPFVAISPLQGAIVPSAYQPVSIETWFDGTYQKKAEEYLNENFGFRNFFIRLNNQLLFSFFRKTSAKGVIIGKEDYLYEIDYIRAYYGEDFVGMDTIQENCRKLKTIQDTLAFANKTILVIMAPGKATYFPEFIPDQLKRRKTITNNEAYLEQFKKYGINYIDLNTYFTLIKKKSAYPLYPKHGIHWSKYGAYIAFDTIYKWVEKKLGIDLPEVITRKIEVSDTARYPDTDILLGMNLLKAPPTYPMAYVDHTTEINENKPRPRLMAVADSYWWTLNSYSFGNYIFRDETFWYYFKEAYPESYQKHTMVADLDFNEVLERQDVIIILATEANMYKIGYGFINTLYGKIKSGRLHPNDKKAEKAKIDGWVSYIRGNKVWMEDIRIRSKKEGLSVDSLIKKDAIWFFKKQKSGM
ncbi:MAG: alginate O-acetyltransferase AlgX-related protein [Bacteroidia bacterium]